MTGEIQPIHIHFFGTFSIQYGNQTISESDNRSKKLWKLLQYIAQNRDRRIPQEELLQLLWSENVMGENPISSLKTLLHRVRNTLDKLNFEHSRQLILQNAGTYYWNPDIPAVIDTDEFLREADLADQIDQPEEKLNAALRAMALYRGYFLGGQYKGEAWADAPGSRYEALYLECYNTAIQILAGEARYDEIVFLSRHAIDIAPDEELYYYNLISALIEKGSGDDALAVYEEVLDLFYHTYRKTPSERLRSLYRGIVRSGNSVEMDIALVREKLEENRPTTAIRCEYDTFKLIYEQKCHYADTAEVPSYLILFTVTSNDRESPAPAERHLDRALSQLERLLTLNLADGDVFTRYSLTQILALAALPGEEALHQLLKKFQQTFKYNNLSCPVELTYKADRV
ncbi:MAG: hypothetical protein IJW98_05745 [Clostridia bacterium]|nr:hypothetical protein [Clostridia bacterium]